MIPIIESGSLKDVFGEAVVSGADEKDEDENEDDVF
tara:strand:+ start:626 stop:733 length:108 start_codon:yes stop_codon:yes gene_type:complete